MPEQYQSRIVNAKLNAQTREVKILVSQAAGNPDLAVGDSSVPAIGSLYSDFQTEAPVATVVGLKCQEVRAERYSPTTVMVTAVFSTIPYGSPSARLLKDDPSSVLIDVDLTAKTERVKVSLPFGEGPGALPPQPIGINGEGAIVYRPACTIRVMHRTAEPQFSTIFATTGKVNASTFLGQPAGTLLYLGAQIKDNAEDDFTVTHLFKYAAHHRAPDADIDAENPDGALTFIASLPVYESASFAGLGFNDQDL